MFTIEKGVPITSKGNHDGPFKQAFAEMEDGDSFFVEVPSGGSVEGKRQNIYKHAKTHNVSIVTRVEANGIRVWKVDSK